ncbi:MAG: hypothetical protein LUD26_15875, partial [Bacteroides uniformis]|nr:hypothetical protein [Bacteroides uniformis]
MKNAIPRYNFYKTKYGSELLIDVVDLQYTRKFLTQGKVHILTYYDITWKIQCKLPPKTRRFCPLK